VVNNEGALLHHDIGCGIAEKQKISGWDEAVIEQVPVNLQAAFPGSTEYSSRNPNPDKPEPNRCNF
jgi:hypothetical protein